MSRDALKSLRQPLVLGTVAVLILAVAVWWFALMAPQQRHLTSLQSKEASLSSERDGLTAKLASLKRAESHQSRRQAVLDRYSAAIPATADLADFITQLNGLASSSQVDLTKIAPSEPAATPGQPYSTITLSLSVKGSYGPTLAFLQGLYNLPRLVVVDNITVSAGTGTGESAGSLDTTLKARAFTTAAPPATPGSSSPAATNHP